MARVSFEGLYLLLNQIDSDDNAVVNYFMSHFLRTVACDCCAPGFAHASPNFAPFDILRADPERGSPSHKF